MNKVCGICHKIGKYKCPRCLLYYCSVYCCNEHKKDNCEDRNLYNKTGDNQNDNIKKNIDSSSDISVDKLQLLEDSIQLKNLLANTHLRNMLNVIDKAENVEVLMHEAMQEPIFVEFADACLKVVDPLTSDGKNS